MTIDELIELTSAELENVKEKYERLHKTESRVLIYDLKARINIFEIALAYLKAHKQGYVLTPIEPTEEMCRNIECLWKYRKDSLKYFVQAIIKDRPKTELDEIIKGLE